MADAGYATPTPIQEQAIPIILQGRDILGCAQTGTGKTASFTLPMIDILAAGRAKARMPRSLILEPTRELAAQVAENFDTYGKYNKLAKALIIGGESMADQIKVLERGADVLIATPGRLLDVFDRGRLLLNDVRILVIDEADRMLDMGFIPDVERIVSLVSRMRQTLLFSATMPPAIRRLADAFLSNPKEITVAPPSTPAATVTQGMVVVADAGLGGLKEKRAALRRLIDSEDVRTALIFCNRKRDVGVVHRSLERHGYDAGLLHGDLAQSTAHRGAREVQARRPAAAGMQRRGGTRPRHRGHEPRFQLRRPQQSGRLRAPDRPDRPRRPQRPRLYHRRRRGRQVRRPDREPDRRTDPPDHPAGHPQRRTGRGRSPATTQEYGPGDQGPGRPSGAGPR